MTSTIAYEGIAAHWEAAMSSMISQSPANAYRANCLKLVLETSEVFLLPIPDEAPRLAQINDIGNQLIAHHTKTEGDM